MIRIKYFMSSMIIKVLDQMPPRMYKTRRYANASDLPQEGFVSNPQTLMKLQNYLIFSL